MSENGLSISFRIDDGIVEHNNREFVAKNVIRERIPDNIIYKQENLREFYDRLFGQALTEYNARQKRKDRVIPDYYEHIRKGKQEKPFYEIVVQFGDINDCGVGSENGELAKKMLDEYMRGFEARNPNIKPFNCVMHLDEATPHLHIDFVPITHSPNRGLSTRVSMSGALREQGFIPENKFNTEWTAWAESERNVMEQILHKYNLIREDKNVRREHLSVEDYKAKKQQEEELQNLTEQLAVLRKKSSTDLSPEEVALIKNQNELMRSEIEKRDERLKQLTRQVGAQFVKYEVFSDEKLQYIADGLTQAKIPFVEDSCALHIPDYAVKTANVIASHYKATTVGTIRERIALDIDRLVYTSLNTEDLLKKLQERGYEIKRGKHTAVKAPFAERFIRLRSLGEEYQPQQLSKRIYEKEKFPNSVKKRAANANTVEGVFYTTLIETTVAIRKFAIIPKKTKPKKLYTYQNDESINYLSEQLATIRDFGISSRDDIYAKAEELKKSIEDRKAEIRQMNDELPTLKSDIAQIRFFFSATQNRRKLDTMEQVKLAAAREVVESRGVKSEADIVELEKRLKLLPSNIAAAKGKAADEQLSLKRVSALIEAYEKIVEGNYIDNLIRAQREQEQNKAAETVNLKKP